MKRSRPVSLALIGVFMWQAACISYRQIQPGEVAEYHKIYIRTDDGIRHLLMEPSLEADSLRGFTNRESRAVGMSWSVALTQVDEIEAPKLNAGATAVGLVIVVGVVAAMVVCGTARCFDYGL